MKLVGLTCALGIVLVAGGCAKRLPTPPKTAPRPIAPSQVSSAQPLFVVDGRVLENGSEVNEIDPNRIERVEVLKGAAAVERFGSRGANGVVLITMKVAS